MKTKITTSRDIQVVIDNKSGQYTLSKNSKYPDTFTISRLGYGGSMAFSSLDEDIKELILALSEMHSDTVAKVEETENSIKDNG